MSMPSVGEVEAFASVRFNYIVIGGGTAGLPIASRLSEDPNVTVGILEAGLLLEDDPIIDIPKNMALNNGKAGYDWLSSTAPQSTVLERAIPIFSGKLVGGSSALNYMGWDRGSKEEYDAWKSFADPQNGWDWESFLPFLIKVEDAASSSVNRDRATEYSLSDAHVANAAVPREGALGVGGPVKVSYGSEYSDVNPAFIKAWNTLGLHTNANPWGGDASGVYNALRSIDHETGKRVTATSAYYRPVAGRPNLKLLTGAQVTRILFASDSIDGKRVASGIEFSVDGKTYSVFVSKEVIISAGTIRTPQILELSGIGNAKILESAGIANVVDLPGVGENHHDHTFSRIHYQTKRGTRTFDQFRNSPDFAAAETEKYEKTGQGWMANIDTTLVFAPLNNLVDESELSAQIIQLEEAIDKEAPNALTQQQWLLQLKWLREGRLPHQEFFLSSRGMPAANPQPEESYFAIFTGLQHPFSRGSVHIQSADPFQQPKIDPRYLTHEFDVFSLLSAYRAIEKLAKTSPLVDIVERPILPATPLPDNEVLEHIRKDLSSGAHSMGTAAMARRELGGVVGSDLKVHGTTNIRVADASIIPIPIAAHIQATVYGIGEKAADLIKKECLGKDLTA